MANLIRDPSKSPVNLLPHITIKAYGMGIVGFEENIVRPDDIDQLLQWKLLVDVTTVDLTGEIFAGLQFELGIGGSDVSILEHVVTRLKNKGNETNP